MTFEEFAALFSRPSTAASEGEGNCVGFAARDTSGHVSAW